MQFQILIPTYNRVEFLKKNLLYLLNEIKNYQLQSDIGIIISDNASPDDTFSILTGLKSLFIDAGIDYQLYRSDENVGLEGNGVKILGHASAEYVIWLGDDDFLPQGFLKYVVSKCRTGKIGWILTGAITEYKDGSRIDTYRITYDEKIFPSGYETIWSVSHYGHKMSGLVIKREGVLEAYLANPNWRNIYLYIYFLLYCQMKYPGVFAAKFKVLVTHDNKKDFSYNSIGLLDEVFKSYNYLIEIYGLKKVIKLLLRFVIVHSYRIKFTSGLNYMIRQWRLTYQNYQFGQQLKWGLLRILLKEYLYQNIYSRFKRFI
jgi:GT2 family glycosyltransferase